MTRQRHDRKLVTFTYNDTTTDDTVLQSVLPDQDCFTNCFIFSYIDRAEWQDDTVEIFALMNVGNLIVTL
jgi:hypothetical protein